MIGDVRDTAREYSPAEEQQLTENLRAATESVDRGELRDEPLSLSLVCRLHRQIFEGVRDHAGRHRGRGIGSEYLSYGPHRSSHRDAVAGEMHELFEMVNRSVRSFEANPEDPRYEEQAVHLAAYAHAKVIRTHPFEDGNGRTSRLLMGAILVRLGLRQIPVEACKQEYIAALNHLFARGEIAPLIDLFLRVDAGY